VLAVAKIGGFVPPGLQNLDFWNCLMLAALLLLLAELKAVGRPERMLPNSVFLAIRWDAHSERLSLQIHKSFK
jgi:hypothetical protein